jgi:hypothetical protein
MVTNALILSLDPVGLKLEKAMEHVRLPLGQEGHVPQFRPCLRFSLHQIRSILLVIQARGMLKFMEQDTCRVFHSVDDNGIMSARIGVSAVDMDRLNRLLSGRELAQMA